jgi:alpha-L-fucosidase
MKTNSKSIHGCLPSPLGHLPWGECTAKPGKLFLHVFKWPVSGTLIVPGLKNQINKIHYLHSGEKLDFNQTDNDVYISVDSKMPYSMNTVIVIEHQDNPVTDKTQTILPENENVLQAVTAKRTGNLKLVTRRWMEEFGDWKYADCLDGWKGMTDRAGWEFRTLVPGEYSIELTYSCKRKDGFKQGICTIGDSQLFFESFDTGEQQVDRQRPDGFTDHPMQFKTYAIGRVVLPEARRYKLTVKPANETDGFFALKSVHLVPYK